jgi:NTP pyrophosphatase (non-canonical NTP hydrolase)
MEINEYQKKASRTLKRMNDEQQDLEHMFYGEISEVGEAVSMLKAHYVYGKEFDMTNMIEELGDIAWFWAGACTILGIDANDVLEKNIDKLRARYPEKFTEYHALNRDLLHERKILEVREKELPDGRVILESNEPLV